MFLEALAGQCALAMERATLYEREHTTAETLQRSLLPDSLPTVPGIILEARCLPVTRNMEIGGDWYDAFRLPDGRLAVATGDVMGKGLTAAAGMGRVRNALRALALTDPRPAAVLAGLDRLFQATEQEEQVTTVAYLVVDPVTGDGIAGNAGHLPPLLLSADGPPRLDNTPAGTPLGWASPRQQYAFRLPPGNTAVLYSDGLVENRKRGLDAGLDELVSVAARAPLAVVEDPALLLGYLVDQMLAGHEQDDDVTVLVLHVPAWDELADDKPGGGKQGRRGRGGHDECGYHSRGCARRPASGRLRPARMVPAGVIRRAGRASGAARAAMALARARTTYPSAPPKVVGRRGPRDGGKALRRQFPGFRG